jgi:hypothetical protein
VSSSRPIHAQVDVAADIYILFLRNLIKASGMVYRLASVAFKDSSVYVCAPTRAGFDSRYRKHLFCSSFGHWSGLGWCGSVGWWWRSDAEHIRHAPSFLRTNINEMTSEHPHGFMGVQAKHNCMALWRIWPLRCSEARAPLMRLLNHPDSYNDLGAG